MQGQINIGNTSTLTIIAFAIFQILISPSLLFEQAMDLSLRDMAENFPGADFEDVFSSLIQLARRRRENRAGRARDESAG